MKSFIKSFVALCAIYVLSSGLAVADIGPAEVSIGDGRCVVLTEDGFAFSDDRVVIGANSANNNITFTCSLDLPRPSAKRSVVFNFDNTGLTCGVNSAGSLRTEDWHQVISASGKAKLVCHYHD